MTHRVIVIEFCPPALLFALIMSIEHPVNVVCWLTLDRLGKVDQAKPQIFKNLNHRKEGGFPSCGGGNLRQGKLLFLFPDYRSALRDVAYFFVYDASEIKEIGKLPGIENVPPVDIIDSQADLRPHER